MEKIGVFIIVIIGLTFGSCQSEKSTSNSESKYFTDSIYSNHLREYRKHNIYMPKGFSKDKKYPIIFATDGNNITENNFYKRTLDSLIDNKAITPLLLIESFSNPKIADSSYTDENRDKFYLDYRYFEYVENEYHRNPELSARFKNHLNYFHDELIPTVEDELNQNPSKNDRYFFGVSNGAGFGMRLFNKKPNTIGTYLCFSIFGGRIQSKIWYENVEYPSLYLEYGSEEPLFLKEDADYLRSKFKELGLHVFINEYTGGHDYSIWNQKFIEIIVELFGNKKHSKH